MELIKSSKKLKEAYAPHAVAKLYMYHDFGSVEIVISGNSLYLPLH